MRAQAPKEGSSAYHTGETIVRRRSIKRRVRAKSSGATGGKTVQNHVQIDGSAAHNARHLRLTRERDTESKSASGQVGESKTRQTGRQTPQPKGWRTSQDTTQIREDQIPSDLSGNLASSQDTKQIRRKKNPRDLSGRLFSPPLMVDPTQQRRATETMPCVSFPLYPKR